MNLSVSPGKEWNCRSYFLSSKDRAPVAYGLRGRMLLLVGAHIVQPARPLSARTDKSEAAPSESMIIPLESTLRFILNPGLAGLG